MGKLPCCVAEDVKKGAWTAEEDRELIAYVQKHSEGGWCWVPAKEGLQRCGKSCRLRWANYLRPGIKRGSFTPEYEETIIKLHAQLGNRIDNQIKNYWNAQMKKRLLAAATPGGDGRDPRPEADRPAEQQLTKRNRSSSAEFLNKLATKITTLPSLGLDQIKSQLEFRLPMPRSGNDDSDGGDTVDVVDYFYSDGEEHSHSPENATVLDSDQEPLNKIAWESGDLSPAQWAEQSVAPGSDDVDSQAINDVGSLSFADFKFMLTSLEEGEE